MYTAIKKYKIKRLRVFFFLFFGTLPEIEILNILRIYIRPTEISRISTFELDFQFIPNRDMFAKFGDVLFNPEKKIIKNEIPNICEIKYSLDPAYFLVVE